MTAKQFLIRVRRWQYKISSLEEHIEFLQSALYPGGMRLSKVRIQESTPDDKMLCVTVQIDEAVRKLERYKRDAKMDFAYAEEIIEEISDPDMRTVLRLYYLTPVRTYEEIGKTRQKIHGHLARTMRDVADQMNRQYYTVLRIHREAIKAFDTLAELPGD